MSNGADPDLADNGGWTSLHFVSQDNQFEIMRLLLDYAKCIDARNSYGNSPLSNSVFAFRGDGTGIKLLLAAGADPKLENNYGVSPKSLSEKIGNYDSKPFFQNI